MSLRESVAAAMYDESQRQIAEEEKARADRHGVLYEPRGRREFGRAGSYAQGIWLAYADVAVEIVNKVRGGT